MNIYLKYSYIILLTMTALFSCRPKSIDLEVQSAEPKLVAFTQVIPDNIMIVTLTKSFSALDNPETSMANILVSGATVKITSNNVTYDFYELNPGVYASYSVAAFEVGQTFDLFAAANGDTITSTSSMLEKATFSSITPSVEKLAMDTNIFLDFSFNDFPNIPNWYLINVYKKAPNTGQTFDVSSLFNNGSNYLIKSMLVSDKEFNGTYQRNLELENTKWNDSIVVTLSNISEKYFDFLGYSMGNGGVFSQMNIEPLNYPTNIVNGYGFFNTNIPDVHFYDLSQY